MWVRSVGGAGTHLSTSSTGSTAGDARPFDSRASRSAWIGSPGPGTRESTSCTRIVGCGRGAGVGAASPNSAGSWPMSGPSSGTESCRKAVSLVVSVWVDRSLSVRRPDPAAPLPSPSMTCAAVFGIPSSTHSCFGASGSLYGEPSSASLEAVSQTMRVDIGNEGPGSGDGTSSPSSPCCACCG